MTQRGTALPRWMASKGILYSCGLNGVSLESQRSIEQRRVRMPESINRSTLGHALTTDVAEEFEKIVDALNEGNFDSLIRAVARKGQSASARLVNATTPLRPEAVFVWEERRCRTRS